MEHISRFRVLWIHITGSLVLSTLQSNATATLFQQVHLPLKICFYRWAIKSILKNFYFMVWYGWYWTLNSASQHLITGNHIHKWNTLWEYFIKKKKKSSLYILINLWQGLFIISCNLFRQCVLRLLLVVSPVTYFRGKEMMIEEIIDFIDVPMNEGVTQLLMTLIMEVSPKWAERNDHISRRHVTLCNFLPWLQVTGCMNLQQLVCYT